MTEDMLTHGFDAVLRLMDRQILDVDGQMAGNVDDIEIVEDGGRWVITSLLVGANAYLDRIGGRVGAALVRSHVRLHPTEPHRDWPWRIPIGYVDHVDSSVHLDRRREEILLRDRDCRRLGRLAGMPVQDSDGRVGGRVIDARVEPEEGRLALRSLLVGRGGPGSMLGYDRQREQGPAIVGAIVRAWHRNNRTVDIDDVEIDWSARVVRTGARAAS